MDHAAVSRARYLDADPGFQEYADLWRELEYARSTFDARNIPRVIDRAGGVRGIPWIRRRVREIPIELDQMKRKYLKLEGLTVEGDLQQVINTYKEDLTYADMVHLKELRKEATQLRLVETRYMDEWDNVRALMEAVATNEYSRRMDPDSELRYYYDDPVHGRVLLTGAYIENMDPARVTRETWYPEKERLERGDADGLTIGDRRRMQTLQGTLL